MLRASVNARHRKSGYAIALIQTRSLKTSVKIPTRQTANQANLLVHQKIRSRRHRQDRCCKLALPFRPLVSSGRCIRHPQKGCGKASQSVANIPVLMRQF
ncbi:MAG: hypothetical protein V7K72_10030 [Nostoc sp.]|uniref:hypothetical protein n=1 Tax=Nostoc sp. TaxID=1180 RepID=UPI002FFB652A